MDITPLLTFPKIKEKAKVISYIFGNKNIDWFNYDGITFYIPSDLDMLYFLGILHDVYQNGRYSMLDVKDKVVINVGGLLGECAIYFSKVGASKVYCIEADPRLATLCKINTRANCDNIEVLEKRVSKDGLTIEKLPKADIIQINLDQKADKYIHDNLSKLKEKYKQVYFKYHLPEGNFIMIL